MSKRGFSFANNPLLSGPALDERTSGGVPYKVLPLSAVERDPNQPRTNFDAEKLNELAESIKLYGVLSPILVRPGKLPGRFTIVAGERRFRASQLAGVSTIPAIISQNEESEGRTLSMQLVENLQRSDLSSLERAYAIGALRDAHALSIRDIADKLSISKSAVQRSLDILELPDDLLNALRQGASESKVLLLSKIEDPAVRASYLQEIDTLTRANIESKVVSIQSKDGKKSSPRGLNSEDSRLAEEIQRSLGMKTKLVRSSDSVEAGRLTIDFYGEADLQILFRKLVSDQV